MSFLKQRRNEKDGETPYFYSPETVLRGADYLTAAVGTVEDLVGRRRSLMELDDDDDDDVDDDHDHASAVLERRRQWEKDLGTVIREEEEREWSDLGAYAAPFDDDELTEEDMARDVWLHDDDVGHRSSTKKTTGTTGTTHSDELMGQVDELGEDEVAGVDSNEIYPNQKAFGPW